jgi:hypothetical protein
MSVKKININTLGIVLLASVMTLGACGKKAEKSTSNSSVVVDDDDGNGALPPENYFYVHHKAEQGILRYTHKDVAAGAWSDKCQIDLDSEDPAARDITCKTESTELDLMHAGLTLKYNVPDHPNCPYLMVMTPFYFRHQPPTSVASEQPPSLVTVTTDQGAGTVTVTSDNGNVIDYGGGAYGCRYDYSKVYEGGPDCCFGKYAEVAVTIPADPANETTTTTTAKEWSGRVSSCLSGVGMEKQELTDDGWPMMTIYRLIEQSSLLDFKISGMGKEVMSPIKVERKPTVRPLFSLASSSALKNFADETTPGGLLYGEISMEGIFKKKYGSTRYLSNYIADTSVASLPRAFSDIVNYFNPGNYYSRDGEPYYYTFICLDQGKEVYSRIRLMVREWNTYSALKAAQEPTSGEDDTSGNEDFPNTPPFPKADYTDWKDLMDAGYDYEYSAP